MNKYQLYEYYKRKISIDAKTSEEYERRIKALAEKLGI